MKSTMERLNQLFSPAQTRAARGLLDWSQGRLASAARVNPCALKMYERGEAFLPPEDLSRLAVALRRAGVIARPGGSAGEGVRFLKPQQRTAFAGSGLPDWLPLVGEDADGG